MHENLPLEPVLACVELVLDDTATEALDGPKPTGRAAERLEKEAQRRREERVRGFFDWLRSKRGVKRIVKLMVYDHPHAPCGDKVIKSCLKGFDIRSLDWDKEDLSVSLLAEKDIAPNLQELWLTWSGRDSALLGWSNKEHGLRMLTKVLCLSLHIALPLSLHWETPTFELTREQLRTLYISTNPVRYCHQYYPILCEVIRQPLANQVVTRGGKTRKPMKQISSGSSKSLPPRTTCRILK